MKRFACILAWSRCSISSVKIELNLTAGTKPRITFSSYGALLNVTQGKRALYSLKMFATGSSLCSPLDLDGREKVAGGKCDGGTVSGDWLEQSQEAFS